MADSFTSLNYHLIFSTKERVPMLEVQNQERIWTFIGGVIKKNKGIALAIGGMTDHVHILCGIPTTTSVSKFIQQTKSASSRWINETFSKYGKFSWQDGYGAFTVSKSNLEAVREYIRNQKEHHRNKTFTEEYKEFIEKHEIEYDNRYLLG